MGFGGFLKRGATAFATGGLSEAGGLKSIGLDPFEQPGTRPVGDYSALTLADSPERQAALRDFQGVTGQQGELNEALRLRALGLGGPSPAEQAAQRRTEEAQRAALALAAGGYGPGRAGNTRAAIAAGQDTAVRMAPQLNELRAQEQVAAQNTYGSALGQLAGQYQNQQGIAQEDQMANLDAAVRLREAQNRALEEGEARRKSKFQQVSDIVTTAAPAAAQAFSDRDAKTDIKPARIDEMFAKLDGYSYKYIPGIDEDTETERLGPMADEFERSGLKNLVSRDERTGLKQIDITKLSLASAGGLAQIAKRMDKLEGRA